MIWGTPIFGNTHIISMCFYAVFWPSRLQTCIIFASTSQHCRVVNLLSYLSMSIFSYVSIYTISFSLGIILPYFLNFLIHFGLLFLAYIYNLIWYTVYQYMPYAINAHAHITSYSTVSCNIIWHHFTVGWELMGMSLLLLVPQACRFQ